MVRILIIAALAVFAMGCGLDGPDHTDEHITGVRATMAVFLADLQSSNLDGVMGHIHPDFHYVLNRTALDGAEEYRALLQENFAKGITYELEETDVRISADYHDAIYESKYTIVITTPLEDSDSALVRVSEGYALFYLDGQNGHDWIIKNYVSTTKNIRMYMILKE